MNASQIARDFKARRDRTPAKPEYQSIGVLRPVYEKLKKAADEQRVPIVTMASAAVDQGLPAARAIFRKELKQ